MGKPGAGVEARVRGMLALTLALLLAAAPIVVAGQKNKDKKKNTDASDVSALSKIPIPDSQAVDEAIGQELGYWQIGDVNSLHKYFADDVVVVSTQWEQPIMGWDNYLRIYQAQRAQISGGHLDRSNTYIKVNGNSAWATYQFIYVATVNNQIMQYRGHTTLVLNKQADRWVIVLNHTSVVDSSVQPIAGVSPQ